MATNAREQVLTTIDVEYTYVPRQEPLTVTAVDLSIAFYQIDKQLDSLVVTSALQSDEDYWQGWSESFLYFLGTNQVPIGYRLSNFHQLVVKKASFGSPLIISMLMALPKGLVNGTAKLTRNVFQRLYFAEQETRKRDLENLRTEEEIRAMRIKNLGETLSLTERIQDPLVRHRLLEEFLTRLDHTRTIGIGKMELTETKVTGDEKRKP